MSIYSYAALVTKSKRSTDRQSNIIISSSVYLLNNLSCSSFWTANINIVFDRSKLFEFGNLCVDCCWQGIWKIKRLYWLLLLLLLFFSNKRFYRIINGFSFYFKNQSSTIPHCYKKFTVNLYLIISSQLIKGHAIFHTATYCNAVHFTLHTVATIQREHAVETSACRFSLENTINSVFSLEHTHSW